MSKLITNRAGIKPIPVELYKISAGDVKKFLEDQIFMHEIATEFERFVGSNGEFSYVKMNCSFRQSDVSVAAASKGDIIAKMMERSGNGLEFTESFTKGIEAYKYQPNLVNLFTDPNKQEQASQAMRVGIYGQNFDRLVSGVTLKYDKVNGIFNINLRPDRVIYDMLSNSSTGEIEGRYRIDSISGKDSDTIVWNVIISRYDNFGKNNTVNPLFGN